MSATLLIPEIACEINIGWTEEERSTPQAITVAVSLHLHKAPRGCETDELDDTICYDRLVETIHNTYQGRSFKLIEHLAYHIQQAITPLIGEANASITVSKVNPPIPTLTKPVSFTLEAL